MNNYDLLIHRLDAFIRKFYANKLIRGLLLFSSAALAFYLLVSVGEYYFYFPSWLRFLLLGAFVLLGGFAIISLVIIPLLKMQKLGKVISHEKAAQIIGTHFPDVQDKLLNVLQLKNTLGETASKELITASIEQKTKELSPIPFQSAVNLARNKRFLPYLLPPALILIVMLFAAPNVFKESAERLLSPSQKFVPKAPFTFKLLTQKLTVPQFEDIEINVKTEGKSSPETMTIQYNGQDVMMQKKEDGVFSHTFYKVSKDVEFNFAAVGFNSERFSIHTLKKPIIKQFKVSVDYPDYTGRKDEVLDNIGDIVAPQGTSLRWVFNTENTDDVQFALGHGNAVSMGKQLNQFYYAYRFMRDTSYSIIVSNKQIDRKDSLHYNVSVIPDQFPTINVQQYNDSMTAEYVLFVGEAGDDYGIRNVALNYTIQKTNEKGVSTGASKSGSLPVPVKAGTFAQFNQMFDIETLKLEAGDKLSYYFSVCDNDAVNGSKCAKSVVFSYEKPTEQKLDSIIEKTQDQVNKDLNSASKQNDKIDKDIKALQEKMLQKNELDWQDKKQMEEMMEKNENLQKQIENIQKKFENNNKQSQNKEQSEQTQEKQENLEKLLDELKNNQLAERMKKMEELMKMLNKDQIFDQLKQIEQDNQLMEKDLDRVVEMMKQLERDMRMEDIAKKAEDLAKKQDELNKQNDAGTKSPEELKKKQDELNKEMEALKKDIAEMEKVNDQMENKADLSDMKKDANDADQNMENSSKELSNSNSSKASKSQKSAKKNLEDLAKKMNDAAGGGGADQLEIDVKATRQLLQNLIRMSFTQEDLINTVKSTSIADPKYVSNIQTQQKLKSDAKMIADSLFALSKRLPMLSSTVNKEIDGINRNMESAISFLEARSTPQATVNQQYVMTGANNLALMLNEVLQQLMDQQAQQKNNEGQPSGSCSKPGKNPSKKPGKGMGMQLGDIISQQQKLGDAMKQMMDKMAKNSKEGKDGKKPGDKPGDKPGGEKPGKDGNGEKPGGEQGGGEQGGGDSEQMAKIAAQQAALRKQLNDINNQLRKDGKSNPNLTKIQQEMDRNETDIVNKRMTNEMLQRQSEILTRLMEAKDAMREQEQGKERESNTGKDQTREIPQQLKDILKNKQSVIDYYKTVPAELKPYYKQMVEEYYQFIK
jgi:DNA repair exonuclease SbcCD ATPase subunit